MPRNRQFFHSGRVSATLYEVDIETVVLVYSNFASGPVLSPCSSFLMP